MVAPLADCRDRARAVRLLVLDIDGTLAGRSNDIRPAVREAVRAVRQRGIRVAIATGRMYRSALRFHRAIASDLPLLAYQGALVRDPQDDRVRQHWTLPPALASDWLAALETCPWRSRLSVHCYLDDGLYVPEVTAASADYGQRVGVAPVPVGNLAEFLARSPAAPTKLLALCDDPAIADALLAHLRQRYRPAELYLTQSVTRFVEAAHPQVNKGNATRYLAETCLGLGPEAVMAVGDNANDVEMLRYAGVGVAMGNAPEAVKAAADWVAPDVEADGVARAIAALLL